MSVKYNKCKKRDAVSQLRRDEYKHQLTAGPHHVCDVNERITNGVCSALLARLVCIGKRDARRHNVCSEGQRIVTISNIGGGAPAQFGPGPAAGVEPASGAPSPVPDDEETPPEVEPVTDDEVIDELARWRRMAIRKVKKVKGLVYGLENLL